MCCRCCQSCLEDLYWNCFEEKFCYDESIANYDPDEDDHYIQDKNGDVVMRNAVENNNGPICNQPISRGSTGISSKIHEEDYRREIQTNVPILAPEILAVFANSQIFQEHQAKLARISTKPYQLAGVHINKDGRDSMTNRETDQEKLIKRLEGDKPKIITTSAAQTIEQQNTTPKKDEEDKSLELNEKEDGKEPRIKFTITPESSPEVCRSLNQSQEEFDAIVEEEPGKDEVILRPRFKGELTIPSHLRLKTPMHKKPVLRNVQSVPYFSVRPASETDIFSISGSEFGQISMTPEVPSISYSNLPKNYEDTPTIEKYKASVSLHSIQTANEAKAVDTDYSMPRYFRRSGLVTQSTENFPTSASKEDLATPKRFEKSKRLKLLRDTLPPLLIHTVRKGKEEGKQVD